MPSQFTPVYKTCERCGARFRIKPSRAEKGRGSFCSRECRWQPRPLLPSADRPGTVVVPLTRGKVAIVDAIDASRVGAYNWMAINPKGRGWYAARSGNTEDGFVYLHRFVIDAPDGINVDHWNRDGLDCTRENLRVATQSQNMGNQGMRSDNSSGFKGVSWSESNGGWIAQIKVRGVYYYLGTFADPIDAALAYDAKARDLQGEFARVNFSDNPAG